MPACLTHHCFAQKVLAALPDREDIKSDDFFWGAQGPDFLFCHRYFPWMKGRSLKSYGNRLHEEDPVKTLGAIREFLAQGRDPAYRSYALGLLCHYSLDSTAHPYINSLAARLVKERPWETHTAMHGEIEAALDAIILRRETGKLPSEVPLGGMVPKNEAAQRRIAVLYRDMILRVYGEDVPVDELYRATCDAHFVFSLLTDRTGLKLKAFTLLEKGKPSLVSSHFVPLTERSDVDYANVGGEEWASRDSRDFFQIYEDAAALAWKLIADFSDCDLAALTKNRPFG